MGLISNPCTIAGSGFEHPMLSAGAPGTGTDAVQTITIGGTPDGGSFKLQYGASITAAITWTATDADLVAAVDEALEALPEIGTAGVVTAAGTLSSGIGTITVTFSGTAVQKLKVPAMSALSSLTGSSPTVSVANTTPGVTAYGRGSGKGAIVLDTTNGVEYINTGTSTAPTWTKVGTQS